MGGRCGLAPAQEFRAHREAAADAGVLLREAAAPRHPPAGGGTDVAYGGPAAHRRHGPAGAQPGHRGSGGPWPAAPGLYPVCRPVRAPFRHGRTGPAGPYPLTRPDRLRESLLMPAGYPPLPEPFAESLGRRAQTAMAYRLVPAVSDAVRRAAQKRLTGQAAGAAPALPDPGGLARLQRRFARCPVPRLPSPGTQRWASAPRRPSPPPTTGPGRSIGGRSRGGGRALAAPGAADHAHMRPVPTSGIVGNG